MGSRLSLVRVPAWTSVALLALLAPSPSRADLDEIQARGTLRVIGYIDHARPEFFSGDPERPGFDYEILFGFARSHQLKLELTNLEGGSDVRIAALLKGRGDLVAGRLGALPERRRQIDLTDEVFPYRMVVVTRRPTPVIRTSAELRKYKVGFPRIANSKALVEQSKIPPNQLDVSFAEPSDLLEGLRSGRVQAILWGVESALPAQKEDPELQLGLVFSGPVNSLVYGVRKGNPKLLQAFNEYLAAFRRSANWNRLLVKYFGKQAPEILKKARAD